MIYSAYSSRNSFGENFNNINLNFRTPTPGPELDILYQYINNCLPIPRPGQCRTIFIEPKLESGYPDAVIVYWSETKISEWNKHRRNLTKGELRLLHFICTSNSVSNSIVSELYGDRSQEYLNHLSNAGLIYQRKNFWVARPLNSIFAIRRIISIEAKLVDWRQGVLQAVQNTWFSSESYLLLPKLKKEQEIVNEVLRSGIGLLTLTCPLNKPVVKSNLYDIPRSYASWLFNEWIWRMRIN